LAFYDSFLKVLVFLSWFQASTLVLSRDSNVLQGAIEILTPFLIILIDSIISQIVQYDFLSHFCFPPIHKLKGVDVSVRYPPIPLPVKEIPIGCSFGFIRLISICQNRHDRQTG